MTPTPKTFVSYRRVSTKQQGDSKLGLQAQWADISRFLDKENGTLLKDFEEIKSGTDKKVRPTILKAIQYAKDNNATLIIAKLDRLARSVAFLQVLFKADVEFIALDMPQADRTMLNIMMVFAEHEGNRIRGRINSALSVLKSRGVKLGPKVKKLTAKDSEPYRRAWNDQKKQEAFTFADKMYPTLKFYEGKGLNNLQIARELNLKKYSTPSGIGQWTSASVSRCLKRVANSSNLYEIEKIYA